MAEKTKKRKVRKVKRCYSGIGGQAVLEGIMMKNNDKYSVAVRTGNGTIAVDVESCHESWRNKKIAKIPFIRGVFNFASSLSLGLRSLNYSAELYEEDYTETAAETASETAAETAEAATETLTEAAAEAASDGTIETAETVSETVTEAAAEAVNEESSKAAEAKPAVASKPAKKNSDKALTTATGIIAVLIAVGLFMVLPVYITKWITADVRNDSLIAIIEGGVRLGIFLLYIIAISLMKDIRRVYMYHGAEHKCINCIERGKPLTVRNVMRSSRMHKRCGTSFLLFVVVVSIIVFFFIRVDNMALKILLRIALIPVIAGISYEILRLAGRFDNVFTTILSSPGLLLQRLTTREPDEEMAEVAIRAVEAVFDWRQFLKDEFGRDYTDTESE